MLLLAFETSCDDTSVALFEDTKLLAMNTKSQIREHQATVGVVPEVAARLHANNIFEVLEKTLADAGKTYKDIEYIVCTVEPGLLPSLLVGMTVAKTLAHSLNIPLIPINHIQAHIFANLLERNLEDIRFPVMCLTISGGHNELYYWKDLFDLERIAETRDDASGEAFDKVAKMMWLGYPGGPIISQYAAEYEANFPPYEGGIKGGLGENNPLYKGIFPIVMLEKDSLDFSFSGLKSAVKREVDRRKTNNAQLSFRPESENSDEVEKSLKNQRDSSTTLGMTDPQGFLTEDDKREIAYEFEMTVVEILKRKLFMAQERYGVDTVMLAGWVSCNNRLKKAISEEVEKRGIRFFHPVSNLYSMDNAAMVGILGYYMIKNGLK